MTQHSGKPGNFAQDREKAVEAGHKGGQHSGGSHQASKDGEHDAGQGNKGNFAQDREKASEAGRKGGSH